MANMQFVNGHIFVPFSKIDQERRIVWGVAQAEEPDCQDDLLDYNGTVRAFSKWCGNVREMHGSTAIGKSVQVEYDPATKAVAVGTYISRGAEDAWKKILDGTYRGYSIGGSPTRVASINKNGRKLRHVLDYDLDELSIVDTPANSRCVITAIQKRGSALVATNVLGPLPASAVARDIFSLYFQKEHRMPKRAKIGSLMGFSKALGEKDEVIVARMSDFTRSADGKLFTLKPDAAVASFKKADLDDDGYSDAADDTTDDAPAHGVDTADNAQDALNMHDDWHKIGGHEDCKCNRDNDALPIDNADEDDHDSDGDSDDDMGKSRGSKRRKGALRKNRSGTSNRVLESLFSTFAKSFDAKLEAFGTAAGGAAPRKGDLVKRDDEHQSNDPAGAVAGELKTAYARRDEFLKKGSTGLSPQDRSEREELAKQIITLETTKIALTGSQAR